MRAEAGVVVVGAGAAGHSAVSTLREHGYDGRVDVVHAEALAPYNRTLVNKAVLQGLLDAEQIALPALAELDVEVVRATAATIDPEQPAVVLDDGRRLRFRALVAATGSVPRNERPGAGKLERVVPVHTVGDAERVRELLGEAPNDAQVTVLGAGFIGAETASYLAQVGAMVHLVSRPALPLAHVLGQPIACRVAELHREHVGTYFGCEVADVVTGPEAAEVHLADGRRLGSDVVVVAHGTVPASGWATGADDGIVVDDRLRAVALPGVYAAGGVAMHLTSCGAWYRIDHWDAAVAQGAHAARALLHDLTGGADPGPYLPSTGFTLNLYRHAIAGYGVPAPDALQRHLPAAGDGILTTFHDPERDVMTAAVGLAAGGELASLRAELARP